jgi:outer membrane immunogenic protein
MKKILLASVATLATVSAFSAFAADLPSRKAAPVYAPPPPMWTGFYAGLNAGYNFGTNNNSGAALSGLGGATAYEAGKQLNNNTGYIAGLAMSGLSNMTQSGFIGGGQVGYNYQYGTNLVIGIEADIQGAGIRGSGRTAGAAIGPAFKSDYTYYPQSSGSTTVNAGVDWLGTVRGRIGYLVTPTMLLYGTGGLAYGGVHANVSSYANMTHIYLSKGTTRDDAYSFRQTFAGNSNQSQTLVGWTAGGGVEWMFMPNLSLKAEALYWNLGNMNVQTYALAPDTISRYNVATAAAALGATRVNYQGVAARAGINYHFNWGAAPVVAAY